jgi:hypothetical protein
MFDGLPTWADQLFAEAFRRCEPAAFQRDGVRAVWTLIPVVDRRRLGVPLHGRMTA